MKVVVVKFGSKGCHVTDRRQSHNVEVFKLSVVDPTRFSQNCTRALFQSYPMMLYKISNLGEDALKSQSAQS